MTSKPGPARHIARMREIAVAAVVSATARVRLARAANTQSRVAAEQLNLCVGDLVDVFRTPSSKDLSGWRGPCRVVSIATITDGHVDCAWQGQPLSVRIADLRRSMTYAAFLSDPDLSTSVVLQFP